MNRWLGLALAACVELQGAALSEAIGGLKDDRYGFVIVDRLITDEELEGFQYIDIQSERFYHQFGELEKTQEGISDFLSSVGANERELASQAAAILAHIASQVIEASGKETAWIHLRASVPTDKFDLPRWHMDGYYYIPEGPDDLLFKFAATFLGPPTLFYRLPSELRNGIRRHIPDRKYMKEFCQVENIVTARVGEGVVFIGGRGAGVAALHSEPPIHENRLFFSVIPCSNEQLPELKARVFAVYPKN